MRNIRLQPHRETITVIKNYLEKWWIKFSLFLNNDLSELFQFFCFKQHFIQNDLKSSAPSHNLCLYTIIWAFVFEVKRIDFGRMHCISSAQSSDEILCGILFLWWPLSLSILPPAVESFNFNHLFWSFDRAYSWCIYTLENNLDHFSAWR